MQKKTLWAIAISFVLFMGWQKLYLEPQAAAQLERQRAIDVTKTSQSKQKSATAISANAAEKIRTPKNQTIRSQSKAQKKTPSTMKLKVRDAEVLMGSEGKLVQNWQLDSYRRSKSKDAPKVDLESLVHQIGSIQFAFDREDLGYLTNVQGTLVRESDNKVSWVFEDNRVSLKKTVEYSEQSPYLNVTFSGNFKENRANNAFIFLRSQAMENDEDLIDRYMIYWTEEAINWVSLDGEIEFEALSNPVKWIGTTNRYFTLAIVNNQTTQPKGLIQPVSSGGGRLSMLYPITDNGFSIPTKVYFGPKDLNLLREVEPTLDHAVDFGWFTFLAYPILRLMKWLHEYFHNYGIAIILMTLLLKIVTFPLNYKSMKSMKQMASLKPQIERIQKKHKDNPQAKNQEMMMLMKNHGYNPMAGCLPILVQMPVFFALYRVLYSSVELYQAPFLLWINDLSVRDPYFVTPILLTITMFLQQKLTPNTATDPMQQKVLQWMPVFFGAIMVTLPSGLTLYMLVNAVASIFQQLILNKKLDTGNAVIVQAKKA